METAWQQVAENGIGSLSLRGIARELGITAPAIYNYFPRRDDLINALVMEAFGSFADALETASNDHDPNDHAGRYLALGYAYRAWALSHPRHYMFIFGTPIESVNFTPEVGLTSIRSFLVLMSVIGDALDAGAIRPAAGYVRISPIMAAHTKLFDELGISYAPEVFYLAMETWSFIHGLVSLELVGHMSGFLGGLTDEFIAAQFEGRMRVLGLLSTQDA